MAFLTITFIVLLFIYYYDFVKFWLRSILIALKLRGPKSYPIIGSMLVLNDKDLQEIGTNGYEKYGSIFCGWMFIMPVIITYDPKVLQIILGSNKHTRKTFFYRFMHTFLGEGLITNNDIRWKLHRKLIQPYFCNKILEQFVSTFCEIANKTFINKEINNNEKINVTKYVNNYVLSILQECVLGISQNDLLRYPELNNSPFRSGHVLLFYRMMRPWYLLNTIYKKSQFGMDELRQKFTLQEYTRKVLELRRSNKLRGINCKCLMEMFMEIANENEQFNDDDITEEICTFMLAGQDSVASAIAFSLYYLAKNGDVQMRARSEIDTYITKNNQEEIDINVLDRLTYLEQCVKETLRLAPSVPMISRTLTEDVLIGKHNYPKGTIFLMSPFATHRLKHIYREPLKYDPDRFTFENERKLPQFSFIPFSGGPRNCIGYKFAMLEIKTILALILKNYELFTDDQIEFSYRVTLRAKGGIWIKMKRRD